MVSAKAYLDKVMEAYFEDYGGPELSILLRDANARKLKDACLFNLQQERFSGNDIVNLNHFLNQKNPSKKKKLVTEENLIRAVEDYQGFKKVEMFIKRYRDNPESSTDDRNIEFLASLIDFEPRPFSNFRQPKNKDLVQKDSAEQKGLNLSEKELLLFDQLHFNRDILEKLKDEILVEVLKNYDLERNESFLRYKNKIKDTVAMQTITIARLETKVHTLQTQLKRARIAKRWAGGLGLFFVSIDYRQPSIDNLFSDLLEAYEGIDEDDILEDLI